ncbi:MAG: J domain-containing protein [Rhodospirillaceae bacterium]|nr:J domain-containing protein [Rhodospirillaceae bacterium]
MNRARLFSEAIDATPEMTAGATPCPCAWAGCRNAGEYRAPRDRSLADYVYFCLDHVRSYNAAWDYHAGLGEADIEREIRSTATWDRPTWKLGALGPEHGMRAGGAGRTPFEVDDPLGLGRGTAFDPAAGARARRSAATAGLTPAQRRALATMELDAPLDLVALKAHYKALVKRHHPDANGGSREAERRMQAINAAFAVLKAALNAAT